MNNFYSAFLINSKKNKKAKENLISNAISDTI